MPIFRYFIFVGGALLALFFVADLVLPKTPLAQGIAAAGGDQPLIRIHSDRKLPERVVLDTSQPVIAAPAVKTAAVAAPPSPVQAEPSQALAEMSAKARVRETFAQFVPGDPRVERAGKGEAAAAVTKKAEAHPQPQPKRKVAKTRYPAQFPGRPMMLVAQQPHFGLFTW
jgi:hypothetical protein